MGERKKLKAGKNLATAIETSIRNRDEDSKGDGAAKKIFTYRKILAVLLQLCVNEYEGYTAEEIYDCIDSVKAGTEEVSAGLKSETVRQENVESQPGSEKRTCFDVYFDAFLPKSKNKRRYLLKIDLEIQKTLKLTYPIENRAVYYLAREISGQLDYVYESTTEYKDLQKVITIWLCLNDIPKRLRNTVIRYKMVAEDTYGISRAKAPSADLMEMIMIRLGGNLDERDAPEVIKYLYGIFENEKYGEQFDRYITVEDTRKEPKIRKELREMSGVALLNYTDGKQTGRILSMYYDAGFSEEEIAEKIDMDVSYVRNVIAKEEPLND